MAYFFVKLLVLRTSSDTLANFFKFFEVFWMSYQANDATFISHTAGTTCTVSVGFTVSRDIEVDDHFQIFNIDASCQESVPSKSEISWFLNFSKITLRNLTLMSLANETAEAPLNWRRSSVAPRSERLLKKTRPRKSGILENLRRSSTRLRLSTLI